MEKYPSSLLLHIGRQALIRGLAEKAGQALALFRAQHAEHPRIQRDPVALGRRLTVVAAKPCVTCVSTNALMSAPVTACGRLDTTC